MKKILLAIGLFVAVSSYSFGQQVVDEAALNTVVFYPNPVKENLTVRFPQRGNYTVTIFNIIGDKVTDKTVMNESEIKFDVSDLPKGLFFLRYEFEGKVVTKRFTKSA